MLKLNLPRSVSLCLRGKSLPDHSRFVQSSDSSPHFDIKPNNNAAFV